LEPSFDGPFFFVWSEIQDGCHTGHSLT
jgi:hypothetical protein